jgi:sulfoxide reductase heme-binding subunit YedZ
MPTSGTIGAVTGVISLVLITAVVVLGVGVSRKGRLPGVPARYAPRSRYAGLNLHQNLSLLAVVFLALHILAAVAGPFGGVPLALVVIPFAAGRSTLWLSLGTIASDLMAALVVTSLVRRHLGRRAWRAVHWLAYACWPAALAHSVGTGTGLRAGRLLDLAIGCVAAVLVAVGWRLAGLIRTARTRSPDSAADPGGAAR